MEKTANDSWEKLLNPETLKGNLITASVFLTVYELLQDILIGRLREFFADPSAPSNGERWPRASDTYRAKVLCLDKREATACAIWFRNNGAIQDQDLEIFRKLADHRNEIAHELPSLVMDAGRELRREYLLDVHQLVKKIEYWWVVEVVIPTTSENLFSADEAEPGDIFSMLEFIVRSMIQIACEDDSGLRTVFDAYRRA